MSTQAPCRQPRVFISYSHDSREHCDRVLTLAQQLRGDGIEAELDQFHQDELLHWPRWCEEQLRPEKSDFVLCVCTEEYKRRVEGKVSADVGKGVFWEGTLIYNYLYDEKGNRRCIPLLLGETNDAYIPTVLSGYTHFTLQLGLDDVQSDYAKLYRLLTRQPGVEKAELGAMLTLPPLPKIERKTDFTQLIEHIRAGIIEVKNDTQKIKSNTQKILSILENQTPPPSTPERPHNLPLWMPPEYFVGRGEELHTLCDGLVGPQTGALAVVQPWVVRGGSGTGKTRLAIQSIWVLYLRHQCDMAFYVSAASPSELDLQLAALGEKSLLNLYPGGEPPHKLEIRRRDVIHALRGKVGRWVMLLDGADSEAARGATSRLIKELAGGRFVITSRREDWPWTLVRELPVSVFKPGEARICLRSRYWKTDLSKQELDDFDRIANELGYLPLALAIAASYMGSRRIPPASYLVQWEKKRGALLGFSADDVDYDRSLLAAFKLSYDQLDLAAAALLDLLAWLASALFPRRLVEDSEFVHHRLLAAAKTTKDTDATAALAQLRTLSLIQLDEESIQLHKLVLECARAIQPEQARRESFDFSLAWLVDSLPAPDFDVVGWQLWTRLVPHLDGIIETAVKFRFEDEKLSRLCNDYGLWLYHQARYQTAEPLFKRALAIWEKALGPEHPDVAASLNNLALLYRAQGQYAKAEPLYQRALAIREKALGPEHPDVAQSLNNLAALYYAQGQYAEAEPLYQRALAIWEKALGPEHPYVATSLNNLARLYRAQGQYAKAEPLYQRALAIREKALGPEHPDVAQSLNNLAVLYYAQGQYAEAEPLFKRALAIVEKALGPEHPYVATSLNNLAELYRAQGQYAEAEPLYQRALAIREKALGPEHPHVATSLENYAALLWKLGRKKEAKRMEVRAKAVRAAH